MSCVVSSICVCYRYGFFEGTASCTEGLASYCVSFEARVEHDINGCVKAAIESSMDQLGTVGAMAMEDVLQKMKVVLKEIVS